MGFAGVDKLYRSDLSGDLLDALAVGENQVAALVSRGATRKAESEDFLVQSRPGEPTNLLE